MKAITDIIEAYKEPFDADFWSQYKAIEKLTTPEIFNVLKKEYKGIVKKFSKGGILPHLSIKEHVEILAQQAAVIKQEWEDERERAKQRGLLEHQKLAGVKIGPGEPLASRPDGVYTEVIFKSTKYNAIGRADRVDKTKKGIIISDYKFKTNLQMQSYKNAYTNKHKMMLPPLHNIQDCDLQHITLQLSAYAVLAEQEGFRILKLLLHHIDENDIQVTYNIDYKKSAAIRMLEHSKR